jgi:hypothetical protein
MTSRALEGPAYRFVRRYQVFESKRLVDVEAGRVEGDVGVATETADDVFFVDIAKLEGEGIDCAEIDVVLVEPAEFGGIDIADCSELELVSECLDDLC